MKKILLSVLMFTIVACLQAQTIKYVKPGATGNGTSWSNAGGFQNIIDGAGAGDSIFVAGGTYLPASGQSFSMKDSVKIYGSFAGTETSLSQRNLVANIIAGDSSVLKNGENLSIIDNSGNNLTAAAVLDGFTLSDGFTLRGGAMNNSSSSPTITNCTFLANRATYGGGAIYNINSSSPTITNCTFANSRTLLGSGAGIYNDNFSSPVITNCTFSGNKATFTGTHGGAIYNLNLTSPIIINCTFWDNESPRDGGAIYIYASSHPTITNCVFWGNMGGTFPDIVNFSGFYNLTYSYTVYDHSYEIYSSQGNIAGNGSIADPFVNSSNPAGADGIFGTADDGLHLNYASGYFTSGKSPIDVGNNSAIPSGTITDVAGSDRIQNSTVDMGSFEGNSSAVVLPITLLSFTGMLNSGMATLQWQSAAESNFKHYELEHLILNSVQAGNATGFTTLAIFPGKGSNSSYRHSFAQTEPTVYYRLKMVDNDGRFKYSNIVRLSQTAGINLAVYPNPATSYINIKTAIAGIIKIYDAAGTLLITQSLQAGLNTIHVSGLSAGTYYGVINGTTINFIKK